MNLPLEGSCECGATRFKITAQPLFTHACHCLKCQRRSGSAFAMSTFVLESDLEVTSGTPTIHAKTAGTQNEPFLCDACETRLWLRPAFGPGVGLLIVRSGVLSDKSALKPQAHIHFQRKQDWFSSEDGVPTFNEDYVPASVWPASSVARYEAMRSSRT